MNIDQKSRIVHPETSRVYDSLIKLLEWTAVNGLAGYDPYDALTSRCLYAAGQRSQFAGRLAIQGLRLLPLNPRALLGIQPAVDAKALGLLGRAYFLLWDHSGKAVYRQSAVECLKLLEGIVVPGFAGTCWAHPFPYISSRSNLPAHFPTVVSTVYAAQAFLDGYEREGESHWLEFSRSACDFILKDLAHAGGNDRFYFSYYPGEQLAVHNASLLAAALLARVARLTGENTLLDPVRAALHYTLDDQQRDGSWPYDSPESASRAKTFVDGFHTGFVLESLVDISKDTDINLEEPITRGLQFYMERLFEPSGQPRRLVNRLWPSDLRDCAQAIIVLSRLKEVDQSTEHLLHNVMEWTVSHMQSPSGYFYYLRWRRFVPPISYIRFQGWMMVALTRYLQTIADYNADKL